MGFRAETQACYSAEGWGRSHQGPFRPGEKPQSRRPASLRGRRSQQTAGNRRKNNKSEENRKSLVSTQGQMWRLFFYNNFGINKHCRHSCAVLLGHYADANLLRPHNVKYIK